MRAMLMALVFGLALIAPDAFAQIPGQGVTTEEAPVESYLEPTCEQQQQRRGGRLVRVRRCVTPVGMQADASVFDCAPRYAYRGHRRVNLPMPRCRPLFA